MNLRIKLYETIINKHLQLSVVDLDNEGRAAILKVYINSNFKPIIVNIPKVSGLPHDVQIKDIPHSGKHTEITAKIYDDKGVRLHDTDTRLIKL